MRIDCYGRLRSLDYNGALPPAEKLPRASPTRYPNTCLSERSHQGINNTGSVIPAMFSTLSRGMRAHYLSGVRPVL